MLFVGQSLTVLTDCASFCCKKHRVQLQGFCKALHCVLWYNRVISRLTAVKRITGALRAVRNDCESEDELQLEISMILVDCERAF
jgi:hypothetical protein